MALGERIHACRQNAGLSQEKLAELVGVSRQAVTKWESNQSAPNTENLFKLAELFGTTVDLLLSTGEENSLSPAEEIYRLSKMEQEQKAAIQKQRLKRNALIALLIAGGYMALYGIGRILWCNLSQSNLIGWLFTAIPSGEHSYLYGWLLSSNLFWYAMALSVLPAFFGAHRFSCATLIGFILGFAAGMIFGPHPEGAALGQSHYGWAIWGTIFLISIVVGILLERHKPRAATLTSK